ncbi:MAG TPA: hypothetical protein VJ654_20375 [Noviherbaspirillum sp.]|nr:hypothetical protein [Noviherbaspirillum sp.]
MRSSAIQEQLDDLNLSLNQAEARRSAAAAELVNKPGDMQVRNRLREATTNIRELRDDKDALEFALAEAKRTECSDDARQKRERVRQLVKDSIGASQARVTAAAAVDKAIAQLGVAMGNLVQLCDKSVSTAMDYLSVAHRGDSIRHGDHAMVFRSEARGDSYMTPAIGKALGQALKGLELPNVMLRDWLHVNGSPCSPNAVQEAAEKCVERYAPRIVHHLDTHIGLEEPRDEQNA